MLNRSIMPEIKPVTDLNFEMPEYRLLENGRKLYVLPYGDQEVIRFDLFLHSGSVDSEFALDARFAAGLLKEGSEGYSAKQIAEMLDSTGSYLQPGTGMNHTVISLFVLQKHLKTMMPLVASVVKSPLFDEREFENYRIQKLQQFKQSLEKAKYLSAQEFKKQIFGEDHPYGSITREEDYHNIKQEHLFAFHKKHYSSANCDFMVSGWVNDEVIRIIETYFGGSWGNQAEIEREKFPEIQTLQGKSQLIKKDGAVQSAINMGYASVHKSHPDFMGLQILNTIFGGYFGSRLMQNIRETKGYTYGIGSVLLPYPEASLFSIHTETANEYRDEVIREIGNEIHLLQTEPVSEEELDLVKNYLRGDLMRNTDTLFPLIETVHSLLEFDLDATYLHDYLSVINKITAEELMRLANVYLKPEMFNTTIVGG